MARDHYAEARTLAAALREDAALLELHADRIDLAITAGFTSSEILMGLRLAFRDMLERDSEDLPRKRRAETAELLRSIETTLGAGGTTRLSEDV